MLTVAVHCIEKLSEGDVHWTTFSIVLALYHHAPLILLKVGAGWLYSEH